MMFIAYTDQLEQVGQLTIVVHTLNTDHLLLNIHCVVFSAVTDGAFLGVLLPMPGPVTSLT